MNEIHHSGAIESILQILMTQTMPNKKTRFLPTSRHAMKDLGWDACDVILVSGDAYIDHPSFGTGLIGRYLESLGLRVGVIAMPDSSSAAAFAAMGRPRLFFGVTAGNLDSMLSLFTAQRKIRSDDPYVPGGKSANRPERATIVYCNRIREAFGNVPIIIGGIEASLRRIAHYDFWSDTVRRSLLIDSKADMLVYGMAEKPLNNIVAQLKAGKQLTQLKNIPQTVVALSKKESDATISALPPSWHILPSYEQIKESKTQFTEMTDQFFKHYQTTMVQRHADRAIIINPTSAPLTAKEIDTIYNLPYTYLPHPSYKQSIPAFDQIRDSITTVRGCYGGCNFCGLGLHQGRDIQSRTIGSILHEIDTRSHNSHWKGIVSDLGGPTANMYGTQCENPAGNSRCLRTSCLSPARCEHLNGDQKEFVRLIQTVTKQATVRHCSINSGIRMDLAIQDPASIEVIARLATGGHLSVAPEHLDKSVLKLMNKPVDTFWEIFEEMFTEASHRADKEQFLIPYFIAGHPGETEEHATTVANYLRKKGIKARQIQEFIPIPMTVSTSIYYTGEHPFTKEKIDVTNRQSVKRRHKEIMMWWQEPVKKKFIRPAPGHTKHQQGG